MSIFGKKGLSHFFYAARYSFQGIKHAYRHPRFRRLAWLIVPASLLPFLINTPSSQKVLLYATLLMVVICELIAQSVGHIILLLPSPQHELARKAEDLCVAATGLAACCALVSWTLILVFKVG